MPRPIDATEPARAPRAPMRSADAGPRGGGLRRIANHPAVSGLVGFLTTVIMLLPVEYEAPLRGALLFLSMRVR